MKNTLTLCTCVVALLSATTPAFSQEVTELQVSRIGDVEMSCGELSQEALTMRDIVDTTQGIKDSSTMRGHGINAATGIGGFLIGSVTGGLGLAAAGFLLSQNTKGDSSDADNVQDIAEQRRSFMIGIYDAKGCQGPMEYALQDKEAVTFSDQMAMQLSSVSPAAGSNDEISGSYPQHSRTYTPQKPRYNN